MYVGVLLLYHVCILHHVYAVPVDASRESQVSWNWLQLPVTDGCYLPCVCWKWTLVPTEEQSILLTMEPYLQPWKSVAQANL